MELYRLGNLLNYYLSKTLTSKTILKVRLPFVTKNSNFSPFLSIFILIFLSFEKMSKKLRVIQISRHFDYRKYQKETEIIQTSRLFLYVYFDFLNLAKMLKDEKTATFGFNKKKSASHLTRILNELPELVRLPVLSWSRFLDGCHM